MKDFASLFFIVLAANIVFFALGFATFEFMMVLLFAIPIEFFVGMLLVFFERHRKTGAALLAASGVTMLVMGFMCSNVSLR